MAEQTLGDTGAGVAKDVQRNVDGTVAMTEVASIVSNTTTMSATLTMKTSVSDRVMYDKLQFNQTSGTGTFSVWRNGTTRTRVYFNTAFAADDTFSATGTPRADSVTWTASMHWTAGVGSPVPAQTITRTSQQNITDSGQTTTDQTAFTTNGSVVNMDMNVTASQMTLRARLKVNGNTFKSTTFGDTNNSNISTTITGATTGTFTSSQVTWSLSGVDWFFGSAHVNTRHATLSAAGGGTPQATFTVSKNTVSTFNS